MSTDYRALIEGHLSSASHLSKRHVHPRLLKLFEVGGMNTAFTHAKDRSEEHTSELQSRGHLVCRLLLEKKKRLLLVALPATMREWQCRGASRWHQGASAARGAA